MPTFGSLFAGIGGIDLGLERAGWECRWQVEWDEWCQRVLAKHWPDVRRYGDITAVDWSGVERVDLLAGGFPCQPFSMAGKRRGKADERWLWPEFARAIRELRPGLVLVENVPGLLAGHGGMGSVLGDLASLGYDAEWDSVPAAAVGAPHLRYRVWIVAYPNGGTVESGRGRWGATGAGEPLADVDSWGCGRPIRTDEVHGPVAPAGWATRDAPVPAGSAVADADGERERQPSVPGREGRTRIDDGSPLAHPDGSRLEGRPVQPQRPRQWPVGTGGMADPDERRWDRRPRFFGPGGWRQLAHSSGWEPEPAVGRLVDGLSRDMARWRVAALKGLGNAVVPQVAQVLGRRLMELHESAA